MAAIVSSGKRYITDNLAGNTPSDITRFILANVPHSDPSQPVNGEEVMPTVDQIVYDKPITRVAKINPDEVVYSQILMSDVGNFDFNWIGLATGDNTLIAVVYVPLQRKLKYQDQQIGNSLTRNIVLRFANAADALNVHIAPETWQFDMLDIIQDEIKKGLDGHNHDDDYYLKSRMDSLLAGKLSNAAKATLTDNDGYGNANVTFNHKGGIPQQSGSSARIEASVDNDVAAMSIELGDSVVEGIAKALTTVISLSISSIALMKNTTVAGWLNASEIKEAAVSLKDKYSLKTAYHEVSGQITLSRTSQKTIVQRNGSGNGAIKIDASTYQAGDEIIINNSDLNAGVATITNLDGTIYIPNGGHAGTHTFTGMGTVTLIKLNNSNHFKVA